MTKRIGRSVVGAAVLLELAGLRGKVLRGVVNGVILIGRANAPAAPTAPSTDGGTDGGGSDGGG